MTAEKQLLMLKEKIDSARENLTKANAVMGEVQKNINKDLNELKENGIDIDNIIKNSEKEGLSQIEIYEKIIDVVNTNISELNDNINKGIEDINSIIEEWE